MSPFLKLHPRVWGGRSVASTYAHTPLRTAEIWENYIYMYTYLCDFAKRCPLSFRLNTGDARVQASVDGKKPEGLASC